MKFQTTPYHYDLLKDKERLAVFFEAICEFVEKNNNSTMVEFDIGCGSGVLSFFSQPYFEKIIAIEIDSKVAKYTKNNLKGYKNIEVINDDAINFEYPYDADLIVCEMLDTALIDEEQVPALINAKKYLKKTGKIIPEAIINTCEVVFMPRRNIHYDDVDSNTKYETVSEVKVYDCINFLDDFEPSFEKVISFKIKKDSIANGVKITTYTKLLEDIVCGPTPMLNPPLLIPIEEKEVKVGDSINIKISYVMGEGIQTIKANYE